MSMPAMSETIKSALDECALGCRVLEMEGHGDMSLGHLSFRDPEGRGFWMKRNSVGLGEIMGSDDFVLVDWDGNQIAGMGRRHSEWPIHSEVLRNRPDVNVVAHSHPFHACVFSASSEPLAPFTLAADYFIDVPRHQDEVALITTKDEGQAMAMAMRTSFAVFVANHGVTFCGTSLSHAICVGVFLEQACKAQLAGMSAGIGPVELTRAIREKRRSQIMTPVHWDHSWNFFRRKLNARNGESGPCPVYG